MNKVITQRLRFQLLLVIGFLCLFAAPVQAATFTVNSTVDAIDANAGDGVCETAPANGECTLRAAVQETNALAGADTITLPAGIYTLSLDNGDLEEGDPAIGDLDITSPLNISGASAETTIIQACSPAPPATTCIGIDRVFEIFDADVAISGMTIRNGFTTQTRLGAPGGGIFTDFTALTVTDSIISDNVGDFGGGIHAEGPLTIINSTISGNRTRESSSTIPVGGILLSTGGTIINSTISGNIGGGILSFGELTITNSTISGNEKFGLVQRDGAITLSSSTITGNPSGLSQVNGTISLRNTLVARNPTNQGISRDCFAEVVVVSLGFNLIENTANCIIGGDTITNISGLDPKLDVLANNGGPTQTHALLPDSPAIDSGNNAACPATDQRGETRPADGNGDGNAVCDIGAYEFGSAPPGLLIIPGEGGNTGSVSAIVRGGGFAEGATAKLVRAGQPDIVGDPVSVSEGGRTITTTFDLTGKAPGTWDVVVTNPDGTSATIPDGFTIEEGGAPRVWVDILGRNQIRAGREATFHIPFGNSGNIDWEGLGSIAIYVPLGIDAVRVRYNNIIVGEFSPRPASPRALVGMFSLPIIPLPAQGSYSISFTPPESLTGGIGAVVILVPPTIPSPPPLPPQTDVLGEVINTLIQTKAIELFALEFPPFEEAFLEAFKRALTESLQELINKFTLEPAVDIILAEHPELMREAVKMTLAKLVDTFSAAVQAYDAIWTVMTEPENWQLFESALVANYEAMKLPILIPPPSPVQVVASRDPNEKAGSQGAGQVHYLSGQEPLRYAIFFENVETATAPAQEVLITDQLDTTKVDLNTFSLGSISFGDRQLTPPPGAREYAAEVLVPGQVLPNIFVRVRATLDPDTGLVTWRFTSIDPATGQLPEDPLEGFLPPNVTPPEGDGSVLLTVVPKTGLVTGTEVQNSATIVFDTNPPIDTPVWLNTLDNDKPQSQVQPLAATQSSPSFELNWAGTDVGAGVKDFTVFVSEDGGAFAPFLTNTAATSGIFTGQSGKTYAFYSVARDQTNNLEGAPTTADTTTQVVITQNQPPVADAGTDKTVRLGSLVRLDGSASSDPDNGPNPLSFLWTQTTGPVVALTGATTASPTFTPNEKGSYTLSLVVNDGQSDSAADSVAITVPILGDIDLDGDVDKNDLKLIRAARNKPVDGPNDLRDLNGDGKINARDVRKARRLCTRPRCATG